MALDPLIIAEAKLLISKAGLANFSPVDTVPPGILGVPVLIKLIDPFERSKGTHLFDKPDPDRPGVIRSESILSAIRASNDLPPILLFQRKGEKRYELRDGFHRLYLCAALGYRFIRAEITDWKPGEY